MSPAVWAFPEDAGPARRLARALGVEVSEIGLHRFPDGEGLPHVEAPVAASAILYRGLAHPDAKLVPLLLAADALRRSGAARVVLVAPYMPYLRQDTVFAPGQPLSRDVWGGLLGPAFDRVVTVEPHLHRTRDLSSVFAGRPVTAVSAARLLARAIGPEGRPLIVGPDAESEPWTEQVAQALHADHLVLAKHRLGDRKVELDLPAQPSPAGRRAVLVDDICSSGGTLETAALALAARGAVVIEAAVVHALFDAEAEKRLAQAGVRRIVSSDSCEHPTNAIALAETLADALREEIPA